jgi:hypothetical protein
MPAMRRTSLAGLALALTFSAFGGPALSQTEPPAEPVPAEAQATSNTPAELTLPFDEPRWRRVKATGGPQAREDHTWVVDDRGRYAYLFGGRDGDREFGDLWRFDLKNDSWKKLSPRGQRPTPRFGHSAVWVEGQGLIIFGGQRGPGFFDQLWAFDPDRRRWRELPADGQVPRERYGSCMIVGRDGRLWISHGFTNAGRFDDTRAYNLTSQRWANLTPAERKPGERCLHDCFTSSAGELVLYGGQDDGAFALGDLWVMGRDRAWDRLGDPRPKPRRLYAVTEAGDYAYIFGGAGEDNSNFDDLWRVDRETLAFERVRVEGAAPGPRFAGTLITDAKRGRLLLFGGQGASARADLWELIDTAEPADETAAPDDGTQLEPADPEAAPDAADPAASPAAADEEVDAGAS